MMERAAELAQVKELRGHIHSYVLVHEHLDQAIRSDDVSRRRKFFAGSLGEAAFERFLNIHGFDANLNENPHIFEGEDAWCSGLSFDVKARLGNGEHRPYYNMLVKASQVEERVDYFVFAWIDRAATIVSLPGFCHAGDLPALGTLKLQGEYADTLCLPCDTWLIPVERLTPMLDLIPLLRDGGTWDAPRQMGAAV
jgi:hypothetical protein